MSKTIYRTLLTCLLLLNAYPASATQSAQFDIINADIQSLKTAISKQTISCEQIITTYLNHIKKYNLDTSRGAAINAFVNINPFALDQARDLDKTFSHTHQLAGTLHCVPVIVKDNIDTIETPSTSGTLALLGSQPIHDAFLVTQLKNAGAIILGKGNMDELAFGGIGISGRLGRTGNAYNPTQSPGGSSGGPAVAVSAGFALVGIGTDNSGSVRIPAAFNGIYGLRPSAGLISQSGIFPRGNLDGVAGPLTRNINDMAIVLAVITAPDIRDPKTLDHPIIKDYQSLLNKISLKNLTIGIVKTVANQDIYQNTPGNVQTIYQAFFQQLTKLGANLKNIDYPEFITNRDTNMAGEVEQIDAYLSAFPSTRKNYKDLCLSKRTMLNINDCLKHIKDTASQNSRAYTNTLKMFDKNRDYIEKIMKQNNVDILIAPITSHGKATYDMLSVNTWKLPLSSNSGLPSIAINVGYSNDSIPMPIGMEIIGKYDDELTLLQIANVIEKNSPSPIRPKLGNPKTDSILMNLSIAQMNNFFSLLGMQTFKQFLWYHRADELTPEIFNNILLETSKDFNLLIQKSKTP